MSVPINELVWAGVWNNTTSYPQYQFVQSPIDNLCYVNINIQPSVGGADPSVQPSAYWVLLSPTTPSGSGGVLTQYFLPAGGIFSDPLGYTGPLSLTIGTFNIPADIVPNSTALLFWATWSVGSWFPTNNLNVLDYRIGFSKVINGDSNTFFPPFQGFVVDAPNNANNVPLSILPLAHTPANQFSPDYTQLPVYVPLTGLQPNQTIYCNFEAVYTNDGIVGVSVVAPFLLYQKQ